MTFTEQKAQLSQLLTEAEQKKIPLKQFIERLEEMTHGYQKPTQNQTV